MKKLRKNLKLKNVSLKILSANKPSKKTNAEKPSDKNIRVTRYASFKKSSADRPSKKKSRSNKHNKNKHKKKT